MWLKKKGGCTFRKKKRGGGTFWAGSSTHHEDASPPGPSTSDPRRIAITMHPRPRPVPTLTKTRCRRAAPGCRRCRHSLTARAACPTPGSGPPRRRTCRSFARHADHGDDRVEREQAGGQRRQLDDELGGGGADDGASSAQVERENVVGRVGGVKPGPTDHDRAVVLEVIGRAGGHGGQHGRHLDRSATAPTKRRHGCGERAQPRGRRRQFDDERRGGGWLHGASV